MVRTPAAGETADTRIFDADLIFAGFWTDKGTCDEDTALLLKTLKNRRVFLFGTAGFGGDPDYFGQILSRTALNLDQSNAIAGSFMCQGKMPESVGMRYRAMSADHPESAARMLENFNRAAAHPDPADLGDLKAAVLECMGTAVHLQGGRVYAGRAH